MALISCKDCGEQVSSNADHCRQCGRVMLWGRLDEVSYVVFMILVAGFLGVIYMIMND